MATKKVGYSETQGFSVPLESAERFDNVPEYTSNVILTIPQLSERGRNGQGENQFQLTGVKVKPLNVDWPAITQMLSDNGQFTIGEAEQLVEELADKANRLHLMKLLADCVTKITIE